MAGATASMVETAGNIVGDFDADVGENLVKDSAIVGDVVSAGQDGSAGDVVAGLATAGSVWANDENTAAGIQALGLDAKTGINAGQEHGVAEGLLVGLDSGALSSAKHFGGIDVPSVLTPEAPAEKKYLD